MVIINNGFSVAIRKYFLRKKIKLFGDWNRVVLLFTDIQHMYKN